MKGRKQQENGRTNGIILLWLDCWITLSSRFSGIITVATDSVRFNTRNTRTLVPAAHWSIKSYGIRNYHPELHIHMYYGTMIDLGTFLYTCSLDLRGYG